MLCLALGTACSGGVTSSDEPDTGDGGGGGGGGANQPGSGGVGGSPGSGAGNGGGEPSQPPPEPVFDGMQGLDCDPSVPVGGAPRVWRLTASQLRNSMEKLLGGTVALPADFLKAPATTGYLNSAFDLRLREADASVLQRSVSDAVAAAVSARFGTLFPCGEGKVNDAACTESFVKDFGLQAFRRPLEAAEVTRYKQLYAAGVAAGVKLGVRAVAEAMLQSPNFLFRSELGSGSNGRTRLTNYEIATAMAYQLTEGPPDAELLASAESGALAMDDEVVKQARRLLASDGAPGALSQYFLQFLEYGNLDAANRDPELFPVWESVRGDLARETQLFIDDVLWKGDGKLATLLTANYTFMNANVAKLYGANVSGSAFSKQTVDSTQRAGLLTQPGLMAHLAVFERTSPVNRGRWIRERVLCQLVPEPLMNVDLSIPDLPAGLTRRQQLEEKTKPDACKDCHSMMNPVGFGFESLDAIGRYRDKEENGTPVDASGTLSGTRDANGDFNGPVALVKKLAASSQVRECMAVQMARYHFGRFESDADGCALKAAFDKFAASDFDIRELAVALVTSESFLYRRK
ncbi:MAG: DUF1592 domain-containing protein [Myxococcales bacterium]|nr:DUF1592 domain-containing protein [Myxococcales bacterium]